MSTLSLGLNSILPSDLVTKCRSLDTNPDQILKKNTNHKKLTYRMEKIVDFNFEMMVI